MPVVVTFDLPVTDKAAFEKNMVVTSTPKQAGSLAVGQLEPRPTGARGPLGRPAPRSASTSTSTRVPAGGGIYGQEDRDVDFEVGDAHIYRVDARTHQMKVFENGQSCCAPCRSRPGSPAFTTRCSGVKVIMEKFETRADELRDASAIHGGRPPRPTTSTGVRWAHAPDRTPASSSTAAPWSVGYQGHANVSRRLHRA